MYTLTYIVGNNDPSVAHFRHKADAEQKAQALISPLFEARWQMTAIIRPGVTQHAMYKEGMPPVIVRVQESTGIEAVLLDAAIGRKQEA